jgi:hypothetical protein
MVYERVMVWVSDRKSLAQSGKSREGSD